MKVCVSVKIWIGFNSYMAINHEMLQCRKPVKALLLVCHDVKREAFHWSKFNHMMKFGLRVVTERNDEEC